MKTGNKNQAVMLSIVAVAAIAFLVIELMPAKLRPVVGASAASAGSSTGQIASADLPLMLTGAPFSHPKLAAKKVVKEPEPVPPHSEFEGTNPVNPQFWGLRDPHSEIQSTDEAEDIAGKDRQKQQGPQITLVGVMDAGTPVAMLQIDGRDGRNYREGEKLAKDVYLQHVDHGYVQILIGTDIHRIDLGDTYGAEEDKK